MRRDSSVIARGNGSDDHRRPLTGHWPLHAQERHTGPGRCAFVVHGEGPRHRVPNSRSPASPSPGRM